MGIIINEYEYVFDDVQFGIDLREWRIKNKLEQQIVADMVGFKTGGSISAIERGRLSQGFGMLYFMRLCNLMDASPSEYFTMQRYE